MREARAGLEALLGQLGPVAVAVSGGVDSMTLMHLAMRAGARAVAVHAVSPAVPAAATARVRAHAARFGWALREIDAGEFADPDYRANPVDRCFFCKTNLYAGIAAAVGGQVLSGANLDDLADYRPGLRAAEAHGVRHPFVEAGIDKAGVRALAAELELFDLAELPAQPCLASRITTGIAIDADDLGFVDRVERAVRAASAATHVRCRITPDGVRLELSDAADARVSGLFAAACAEAGRANLGIAGYRRGSAFVGAKQ